MDALLWLALAAFVAALIAVATFIHGKFSQKEITEEKEPVPVAAPPAGGQVATVVGGSRRSRNVRARIAAAERARARSQAAQREEEEEGEEVEGRGEGGWEEEEEEEIVSELKKVGKIGTKKMRKLQEKADKRALREQAEAMREDRKRREALREEERKRDEEKERLQREIEEEEERLLKEEQEKRDHEEYLKLKEAFVVEEVGEAAEEEEEARGIQDFINFIKQSKVVLLEDLAAEFSMRTQDAIARVQTLLEAGELSGVVDDRGKFIYISREELESMARFIRQRGRVSLAELVSSSNTLINLQPEAASVTVH